MTTPRDIFPIPPWTPFTVLSSVGVHNGIAHYYFTERNPSSSPPYLVRTHFLFRVSRYEQDLKDSAVTATILFLKSATFTRKQQHKRA